ncbi:hypothetical protein [Kribbella sp. NPDC051620]|uniref:hypothetical protein n=1 Tax=Kribbella sp. NPDC051620 TaxID=3364120 RepID=UPI0037A60D21
MTAPLPMTAYRPRLTRTLGVEPRGDWRVRVTGISASGVLPDAAAQEAALDAADKLLPPVTAERPGMAFLIVHTGTEALWGILGWWELDILYVRSLRADLGTTDFHLVPPDGPTACAWELLVVNQERQSWVAHVLSRPHDPDYDGYLSVNLGLS